MNSLEEKALFEENGWEYDHVYRCWRSHDARVSISIDEIYNYTQSKENEQVLVNIVRQYRKP